MEGANDERVLAQPGNPGDDPTDISQGVAEDCFCLSPIALLAGYAWNRLATADAGNPRFKRVDLNSDLFDVRLYNDLSKTWQWVRVSAHHDAGPFGLGPADVDAQGRAEVWAYLLEKAYFTMGGKSAAVSSGGDPTPVLVALLGPITPNRIYEPNFGRIDSELKAGHLVLISTDDLRKAPAEVAKDFIRNRVYVGAPRSSGESGPIRAFNPVQINEDDDEFSERLVKFSESNVNAHKVVHFIDVFS